VLFKVLHSVNQSAGSISPFPWSATGKMQRVCCKGTSKRPVWTNKRGCFHVRPWYLQPWHGPLITRNFDQDVYLILALVDCHLVEDILPVCSAWGASAVGYVLLVMQHLMWLALSGEEYDLARLCQSCCSCFALLYSVLIEFVVSCRVLAYCSCSNRLLQIICYLS
jgi:hypothetical protein